MLMREEQQLRTAPEVAKMPKRMPGSAKRKFVAKSRSVNQSQEEIGLLGGGASKGDGVQREYRGKKGDYHEPHYCPKSNCEENRIKIEPGQELFSGQWKNCRFPYAKTLMFNEKGAFKKANVCGLS